VIKRKKGRGMRLRSLPAFECLALNGLEEVCSPFKEKELRLSGL